LTRVKGISYTSTSNYLTGNYIGRRKGLVQQVRTIPSRWPYLLGALLAAAGLAVFVVLQISTTDPYFRMVLPGSQEIELDKGDYTLFYEH